MYNFVNVIKMNLEKLNFVELTEQEMREVEGGFWKEVVLFVFEKAVEYAIENPTKIPGPNAHTYKLGHVGGGRP